MFPHGLGHVSPLFSPSFADIVPAKGELLPEGVARLAEAFFQDGEITDVWLAMCCKQILYIIIIIKIIIVNIIIGIII